MVTPIFLLITKTPKDKHHLRTNCLTFLKEVFIFGKEARFLFFIPLYKQVRFPFYQKEHQIKKPVTQTMASILYECWNVKFFFLKRQIFIYLLVVDCLKKKKKNEICCKIVPNKKKWFHKQKKNLNKIKKSVFFI